MESTSKTVSQNSINTRNTVEASLWTFTNYSGYPDRGPEEPCVGKPFILPWERASPCLRSIIPHGRINGFPTHGSSGSSHRYPSQFFKQHERAPTVLRAIT